jgi:hypothetical protein
VPSSGLTVERLHFPTKTVRLLNQVDLAPGLADGALPRRCVASHEPAAEVARIITWPRVSVPPCPTPSQSVFRPWPHEVFDWRAHRDAAAVEARKQSVWHALSAQSGWRKCQYRTGRGDWQHLLILQAWTQHHGDIRRFVRLGKQPPEAPVEEEWPPVHV